VSRAVPANANHRVPEHARAETARTLAATPGIRGEPSDAERGRTLLAAGRTGTLATLTPSHPGAGALDGGFPFGSLVAYAVDGAGRPLLCLSDLAEHSRNLAADPRASLMVSATGSHSLSPGGAHSLSPGGAHSLSPGGAHSLSPGGAGDPLALARVTVLGTVVELRGDERSAALDAYRERHPDAFYAAFDDFRLYRLEVASVRYVGGFGRMSWVSADDHAAAEPDPLRPHAAGIVEHMNDDHADALVAYCRVFGGRAATGSAEMVGVDRYGFTMLAVDEGATDRVAVRIPFGRQVDTVGAVRTAMIELLHEARAQG
jgi:heme iron utilization protein